MSTFFIIVSHGVTILGLLALCYGAFFAIASTKAVDERIVRGIALVTGTLSYFAAKALGISIPSLMVESVAGGKWMSLICVGLLIPSFAGFFLARYIMRCMRKHDDIGTRVVLVISSLVLVLFADVYVVAAGEAKLDSMRPLLPNVLFLLTMMGYIVFEYQPRDRSE